MSRTALTLLALVVLAGCSGLSSVADGGTETPTLTPVDVPEGAAATVPSLVDSNESRLVDWHVAALEGVSYSVDVLHSRTVAGNQTNHAYEAVAAPDGRYTATLDRYTGFDETRNRTSLRYHDDGDWLYLRYSREVGDEMVNQSYYRYDETDLEPFDFDRGRQLDALVAAGDLEVANQRTDAGYYRLYVAEPFTVGRLPTRAGTVTDANVTRLYAVATPDGVVVRYRFRYAGRADGHPATGTVRVDVEDIGTARVETPFWYDAARANTSTPVSTPTPVTATGD